MNFSGSWTGIRGECLARVLTFQAKRMSLSSQRARYGQATCQVVRCFQQWREVAFLHLDLTLSCQWVSSSPPSCLLCFYQNERAWWVCNPLILFFSFWLLAWMTPRRHPHCWPCQVDRLAGSSSKAVLSLCVQSACTLRIKALIYRKYLCWNCTYIIPCWSIRVLRLSVRFVCAFRSQ